MEPAKTAVGWRSAFERDLVASHSSDPVIPDPFDQSSLLCESNKLVCPSRVSDTELVVSLVWVRLIIPFQPPSAENEDVTRAKLSTLILKYRFHLVKGDSASRIDIYLLPSRCSPREEVDEYTSATNPPLLNPSYRTATISQLFRTAQIVRSVGTMRGKVLVLQWMLKTSFDSKSSLQ